MTYTLQRAGASAVLVANSLNRYVTKTCVPCSRFPVIFIQSSIPESNERAVFSRLCSLFQNNNASQAGYLSSTRSCAVDCNGNGKFCKSYDFACPISTSNIARLIPAMNCSWPSQDNWCLGTYSNEKIPITYTS